MNFAVEVTEQDVRAAFELAAADGLAQADIIDGKKMYTITTGEAVASKFVDKWVANFPAISKFIGEPSGQPVDRSVALLILAQLIAKPDIHPIEITCLLYLPEVINQQIH